MTKVAILALETGDVFYGTSIGCCGTVSGEVVFNTAMTGYQEILTDPSYARQLIVLTYPHIGNTGTNIKDNESEQVFAQGLIIRDAVKTPSSWCCNSTLSDFLVANNTVAISGIDTRSLTRKIRTEGVLRGCVLSADNITDKDINLAIKNAKKCQSLENTDLAKTVSTKKKYYFTNGSYNLLTDKFNAVTNKYKVAVYDYGVKKNILRILVAIGCDVTVFPAQTEVKDLLTIKPDGVFLSNGPGDPKSCDYAIANIKELLKLDIPIFGICLGHQLLALASGADTKKMKFGHHGANHPVQDLSSKKVMITSQNHGFFVDEDTVGNNIEITHRSLFDNSIQGISIVNKKAFGFQGHPEASPGPHDMEYLFNNFKESML